MIIAHRQSNNSSLHNKNNIKSPQSSLKLNKKIGAVHSTSPHKYEMIHL